LRRADYDDIDDANATAGTKTDPSMELSGDINEVCSAGGGCGSRSTRGDGSNWIGCG